jgi:MFS family permease
VENTIKKISPFILISLLLSNLLIAVSTTVLNTAGPVLIDELGNEQYYSWLFTVYMLFSTVTVPIFGKLSDIFGRKKIFMFGLILFIIASFFAGFSDSFVSIIIFRVLQGLGAGAILPTATTIIGDLLDIEKRGRFQGYFSVIWGISAFLGPLIGSFVTEYLSWRYLFLLNVPLGILTLLFVLPYKEKFVRKKEPINWLSAFLFSSAFLLILISTINLEWIYLLVFISLLLLFYFYKNDSSSEYPFLPFGILKNKYLFFFNMNTFLVFFALFGLESFIPLYLQKEQGIGVLESGFILSGISLGWILSSYPSGTIIQKFGYKKPIVFGHILLVLSTIPFLFYNQDTSIFITFSILFFHGICYGLIQTIGSIGCYELAPKHSEGLSSSIQSFARNIGTTLSLGLMGVAFVIQPQYIFVFGFYTTIFSFILCILYLLFHKKTLGHF